MQPASFPADSAPQANALAALRSVATATTVAIAVAGAAFLVVCGTPAPSAATPPAVVALSIAQERT